MDIEPDDRFEKDKGEIALPEYPDITPKELGMHAIR